MKKKVFTWITMLASVAMMGIGASTVSAASIPSDASAWNGHYYKAYNLGYSFYEAKEYCELKGGHLATITSASENSFITKLADKAGKNCYWLGIKRDSQGRYRWITGETSSYSNWNAEEPDNYRDSQGYGHIFGNHVAIFNVGEWGDMSEDCSSWDNEPHWGKSNFGFVCEWDKPISLKNASITLSGTSYTYTGKNKYPAVTVYLNGKKLQKNTDYTVTYVANKFPGYGYAKIEGKGKYTGSVKKYFRIKPKQITGTSAKCNKVGTLTVKWPNMKYITGYQLQYKKAGGSWKTVKLASGTTSRTITKLSKGTYYVHIRAYATTTGKTAYGTWSDTKTVRVK